MFSRKTYYDFSRFYSLVIVFVFLKRLVNIRIFRKKVWWTAQQILKRQHVIPHNSPSLKYLRNYAWDDTDSNSLYILSFKFLRSAWKCNNHRTSYVAKKKNVPSFSCSNWASTKTQGSWKKNTSFTLCITWRSNTDREKNDDCFFVRIYLVCFFIDE